MAVPLAERKTWSVVVVVMVVVAAVANSEDEDVGSKVARRTLESCTNAETATSACTYVGGHSRYVYMDRMGMPMVIVGSGSFILSMLC